MTAPLPAWLSETRDGVVLTLHAQPGAKSSDIAGAHGDALKVRVAAPPVEGKANEALLAFIARRLGVARRQLSLLAGDTSRRKRVRIEGMTVAEILGRLG